MWKENEKNPNWAEEQLDRDPYLTSALPHEREAPQPRLLEEFLMNERLL